MAKNPKFNNSNMFTGVNDTTHNDILAENNSEVLATQGNVINSIKAFWNNLRRKLVHAITRDDTSNAVGNEYTPVYVDENGEVKQCNGFKKDVSSISNNNIIIDNLSLIVGTTLSLNVTSNINNPNNLLTINNKKVLYPTGVEVNAKIDANTNLLVVYNGEIWILINKMNEVKASNKSTENGKGNGGNPGLMTADDKAKLDKITWGANKYTLPTASTTEKGGVILGASKLTSLDTPSPTSNTGRYYPIQTDKDNKLVVNVPWTDTQEENWVTYLKVGNASSTNNDDTSSTDFTYIKVVENGQVHGKVKVVGSGDTTVSSNNNGELVISSPTVMSYNTLITNNAYSNNTSSVSYLVFGPGPQKANTFNYLAGNGTWQRGILVPIPNEDGKTLKSNKNGTVYWG